MRERPILFSAPMVRAILAGTKTQTRRIVAFDPSATCDAEIHIAYAADGHSGPGAYLHEVDYPEEGSAFLRCPYGDPGDRLWVRETWRVDDAAEGEIRYAADDRIVRYLSEGDAAWWKRWAAKSAGGRWCPSIFIKRWASRLTLPVESVRVERLQKITEEDARAEGVTPIGAVGCPCEGDDEEPGPHLAACPWSHEDVDPDAEPHRAAFAVLWDSINGKRALWSANPWVWAIAFRRAA